MPYKHNAARRHHIPKMSFTMQNWPAYEAGLRRRGSLTLWIEDRALEDWQTCEKGRAGSLHRRGHPDEPDGAHCVQTAVAADRRPDGIGPQVDGSDNLGTRSHHGQPSRGPLYVLIDRSLVLGDAQQ